MIFKSIRSSWLYSQFIRIIRATLQSHLSLGIKNYLHFRGWFTTTVLGSKIELFNFNTELETSLFWKNSFTEVEPSLVAFTALSRIATHILDVGANTGVFAIAAASSNDKVKIFAIEPNYSNFMALKANVKRNALPVICLNVAATSDNKLVTFTSVRLLKK